MEQHRGFQFEELLAQGMTRGVLDVSLRSGFLLLHEDGSYFSPPDGSLDEVFQKPHYIGLTRELALARARDLGGTIIRLRTAAVQLPSLLPNRDLMQQVSERGKEKKQRLLAYLREHPEELRPAGCRWH